MPVIDVTRLSKCFTIHPDRPRSFQDLVVKAFRRQPQQSRRETFWALRDLSFRVEAGETLGIIGSNGSGKSTCLKLLTRIIEPTTGSVSVQGRVSALLELGAGFHPELTGRENVFLNGSVLGLKRREMAQRLDDIVSFAELERFIDVPVKFYSSGMYVRLAFAVAIHVRPDVFLIDEVLAVGDQSFQEKCLERINALKARGVTIVFVSHSLEAVRNLCERALWLDDGNLRADGPSDVVVAHYLQQVHDEEEAQSLAAQQAERAARAETEGREEKQAVAAQDTESPPPGEPIQECAPQENPADPLARYRNRWGSREAEVVDVLFLDHEQRQRLSLTTGEPMSVVLRYRAHKRIEHPMFGLAIHRNDGLQINGPNNILAGFDILAIEGEGQVRYTIDTLPLLEGAYCLTVALYDRSGSHAYDHQALMYPFKVHQGAVTERNGTVYVPARWEHITAASHAEDANL